MYLQHCYELCSPEDVWLGRYFFTVSSRGWWTTQNLSAALCCCPPLLPEVHPDNSAHPKPFPLNVLALMKSLKVFLLLYLRTAAWKQSVRGKGPGCGWGTALPLQLEAAPGDLPETAASAERRSGGAREAIAHRRVQTERTDLLQTGEAGISPKQSVHRHTPVQQQQTVYKQKTATEFIRINGIPHPSVWACLWMIHWALLRVWVQSGMSGDVRKLNL